jgi:hypothetical protein
MAQQSTTQPVEPYEPANGAPPSAAQVSAAADHCDYVLGCVPLSDPALTRHLRTLVDHARAS